jgi:hypothetical protein
VGSTSKVIKCCCDAVEAYNQTLISFSPLAFAATVRLTRRLRGTLGAASRGSTPGSGALAMALPLGRSTDKAGAACRGATSGTGRLAAKLLLERSTGKPLQPSRVSMRHDNSISQDSGDLARRLICSRFELISLCLL